MAGALRSRVAEMKSLRGSFEASGRLPSQESVEVHRRLKEREGAAITALERLRLQLARLTLDVAPEGSFTQQLADARALDIELLEALGGHAGLRHALRAGRQEAGTPTPSPA